MNKPGKILLGGIIIWAVVMAAAFYLRHQVGVVADSAAECERAVAAAQNDIRRLGSYTECGKWLAACDNTRFSPPADVAAPDVRDLAESEGVGSYVSRTDTMSWNTISPDIAFKIIAASFAVRKTGWRLSSLDLAPVPGEGALRLSIGFSTARPVRDGK